MQIKGGGGHKHFKPLKERKWSYYYYFIQMSRMIIIISYKVLVITDN